MVPSTLGTKACSLVLLNIQGFNPGANSRTKWKIEYLKTELTERSKSGMVPAVIGLTETHLKPHIVEAQLKLPDYEYVRSDRLLRKDGGVLLYVHKQIPITSTSKFDNSVCEAVTFLSSVCNSLVIGAYRPPDASFNEFKELITLFKMLLMKSQKKKDILMSLIYQNPMPRKS